jgi:hypothetical protein
MKLTINEAFAMIAATWRGQLKAGRRLTRFGMRGPPGIGKTFGADALSRALFARGGIFFEVGHAAEEDIGGIPVRDPATGAVLRLPIGPLREASLAPCVLVFDEVSRANQSKQGTLLTIANEGRAGDFALHPQCGMIFAWNEAGAEGSDGAHEMIPTLQNRLNIIDVHANFDEASAVLLNLYPADSSVARIAADYVFTAARLRELIQCEPPPGATRWPSPRACAQGFESLAGAMDEGITDPKTLAALLAGHVTDEVAVSYFAIRKIRDQLPSAEEVAKDPKNAKLPTTLDAAIAVMGVIGAASKINGESVWIYMDRLDSNKFAEIRSALAQMSIRIPHTTPDAHKAWAKLFSQSGGARGKLSQVV